VVAPFLRQGLKRGEKVLYIFDAREADLVLGHLQDDGVQVAPYLERGQLCIVPAGDLYL